MWAGTGNGSVGTAIQAALIDACEHGVTVLRSSRTGSGFVMPGRAGDRWVYADTLSPWKARVLLMVALGAGIDVPARIQALFDSY